MPVGKEVGVHARVGKEVGIHARGERGGRPCPWGKASLGSTANQHKPRIGNVARR